MHDHGGRLGFRERCGDLVGDALSYAWVHDRFEGGALRGVLEDAFRERAAVDVTVAHHVRTEGFEKGISRFGLVEDGTRMRVRIDDVRSMFA